MNNRGAFITVEGGDGAGKTTQLEFIQSWLEHQGINVVTTREPGGTALGEGIRELLLGPANLQISELTELMLIFAARHQHLEEVIKPAMAQGKWVLCDRFTDATYAYQGAGRVLDMQTIQKLEQWVQGELRPDLTLILDVPVELGLERTRKRGADQDRFEKQNLTFKQKVRESYLQTAQAEPERVKVLDASADLEAVQKDLAKALSHFLEGFSGNAAG